MSNFSNLFDIHNRVFAWGIYGTFLKIDEEIRSSFHLYVDANINKSNNESFDKGYKVNSPDEALLAFKKTCDCIVVFAPDFFSISKLLNSIGLKYERDYWYFLDFPEFHHLFPVMSNEIELDYLEKFVNKGSICIDVGANIGIYSYHLSKITSTGVGKNIYSFEAVRSNYKQLLKHIDIFNMENIFAYNKAVSDAINTNVNVMIPFKDGRPLKGNCFIECIPTDDKKLSEFDYTETEVVQSTSLDHEFLNKLPSLDFIKIDVEGAELHVINGAMGLLKKHMPIILVELVYNEEYLKPLIKVMRNIGYVFAYMDKTGFLHDIPNDTLINGQKNYFFIKTSDFGKYKT